MPSSSSQHARRRVIGQPSNASPHTLSVPQAQSQPTPNSKRRKTSTAGCFWPACGGQAGLYSDDEAIIACPPAMQSHVKLPVSQAQAVDRLHNQAVAVTQLQPAQSAQPVPPSTSLRSIRAAAAAAASPRQAPTQSISSSSSNAASSLASSSLSPATSSAYLAYTTAAAPRSSTPPSSHFHSVSLSHQSRATTTTASSSSSSWSNTRLHTPQVSSSSLAQDGHSHRQAATAHPRVVVIQPSSPDRKRKREARFVSVDDNSMLYLASLIDANTNDKQRATSAAPSVSSGSVYSMASYASAAPTTNTQAAAANSNTVINTGMQNRLKVRASSQSMVSTSTSSTSLALSEVLANFPSVIDGSYQAQRNASIVAAARRGERDTANKLAQSQAADKVLTTSRDTFGVAERNQFQASAAGHSARSGSSRRGRRTMEHSRQSSELLNAKTTHTSTSVIEDQSVEMLRSEADSHSAAAARSDPTQQTQSIEAVEATITSPRGAASQAPCPPPDTPLPTLPLTPASVTLLAATPPRSHTRSRSSGAGHLQSTVEPFTPRTPHAKPRVVLGNAPQTPNSLLAPATSAAATGKASSSPSTATSRPVRPSLTRTPQHARGMSRFVDENLLPNSLTPPRRSSRRTSPQKPPPDARQYTVSRQRSLKRTATVKRRPTLPSMRPELERADSDATIKASSLPVLGSALSVQSEDALKGAFGTTSSTRSIATNPSMHAPFEFAAQEDGTAFAI